MDFATQATVSSCARPTVDMKDCAAWFWVVATDRGAGAANLAINGDAFPSRHEVDERRHPSW